MEGFSNVQNLRRALLALPSLREPNDWLIWIIYIYELKRKIAILDWTLKKGDWKVQVRLLPVELGISVSAVRDFEHMSTIKPTNSEKSTHYIRQGAVSSIFCCFVVADVSIHSHKLRQRPYRFSVVAQTTSRTWSRKGRKLSLWRGSNGVDTSNGVSVWFLVTLCIEKCLILREV